jgi:O-antigen ligase
MTASTVDHIVSRRAAFRSPAVLMLQAVAVTLMVFPSSFVLKAVGGGGYVAGVFAYFAFMAYIAVTLFGLHNPLDYRYPTRFALCTLWLVSLASYALMDRPLLTSTQLLSADRWLIQLAGISGVILVASEFLRSLDDIHRVLRALIWGGAFCGIVAALQFWLKRDITPYLRLPGFTLNQLLVIIGSRNGVSRVTGTATEAIELGVVAGMLLPLAVYMAMHDVDRSLVRRWLPIPFIAVAVPFSVSRSSTLSAVLALGVLIVCLPPARRLNAIAAIPVAVAFIFLTAHRVLGTLKAYFFAGTADSSISHRVDNYPYVLHQVSQAPWFGQGGGTYVSGSYTNLFQSHILDNQYLDTVIELGVLGLAALVFYSFWPFVAALAARSRSSDPRLRDLSAALAGSALSALVCSAFFDSLSYPMFVYVQALVVGLVGAVWLLVDKENAVSRNTWAYYPSNRNIARSLSTDSDVFRLRGRKLNGFAFDR